MRDDPMGTVMYESGQRMAREESRRLIEKARDACALAAPLLSCDIGGKDYRCSKGWGTLDEEPIQTTIEVCEWCLARRRLKETLTAMNEYLDERPHHAPTE